MVRRRINTHITKYGIAEMNTDNNLDTAKGYLERRLWVAYGSSSVFKEIKHYANES